MRYLAHGRWVEATTGLWTQGATRHSTVALWLCQICVVQSPPGRTQGVCCGLPVRCFGAGGWSPPESSRRFSSPAPPSPDPAFQSTTRQRLVVEGPRGSGRPAGREGAAAARRCRVALASAGTSGGDGSLLRLFLAEVWSVRPATTGKPLRLRPLSDLRHRSGTSSDSPGRGLSSHWAGPGGQSLLSWSGASTRCHRRRPCLPLLLSGGCPGPAPLPENGY